MVRAARGGRLVGVGRGGRGGRLVAGHWVGWDAGAGVGAAGARDAASADHLQPAPVYSLHRAAAARRVWRVWMSRTVRVRLSSCFCYPHVLVFFSTGRETAAF